MHAFAVPRSINFQANIRKPDSSRLEAPDVSYRFKYLNSTGTCTVYIEEFNNVSMVGSGGDISLKMGTGAKIFPPASLSLFETFSNDVLNIFACSEGGNYSPLSSDEKRILNVEFVYTGSGGVQNLNGIEINSVPYALHANEAEDAKKLGGYAAATYARFANFTTCSGGQVLTYNGTIFSCVSPGAAATFTGVLAGDVSGTQSATVVDTVGGKTAAQISTSVDDTLNATSAATASRIVKRDASGNVAFNTAQANNFSGRNLLLFEATNTNHVQVQAPATFTGGDYVLTLPQSKGLAGQVLSTDGNGVTSWVPASSGSVTSVGAILPLTSTGGATPMIAMPAAATAQDGYLTSADWNTFNSKQPAGSYITALTGDVVAAGPGSSAATIQANAITTSKINNLAVTDAKINDVAWGKITGKPTTVAGYGITDAVTNVTAGAPLVSSGGATPNITMPAATAAVDGYLSAANFTAFNNKVSSQWTNNAANIYFNTGNVGIGTNTPAAALDVNGVILANAIASTSYVFKSPGDTDGGMTSTADGVVQFLANGAERMRITPGAVGIGTTTPAAALDVNGGILANSVQSTSFSFKSPGDTDGGLRSTADGLMQFMTNSVERMRLDSAGNLGVGTTSAAYKVDVVGDVNVTGNFKINGVNIASGTVSSVGATLPLTSTGGANPTIAMPAAATAQDGYLASADWNTFNNKLSSTLAPGNIFVGNGSSVATGVALSGDVASVSNTGSVTLASTVTAGTVGSASAVPTITYDAKGRITGTSSNAYQDATGVTKGIVQAGTNISVTGGVISVPTANGVVAGVLSAADYNTFNGKVSSQWITTGGNIYNGNAGNVGIGTSSPVFKLDVSGAAGSGLRYSDGTVQAVIGTQGTWGYIGTNSPSDLTINTNSSERMRITSSGDVGVGISVPAYKLDVNGDINIAAGSNFKINGVNIASGTVTGTGTANKVSKFTAAGAIGDSNITDNGTVVDVSTDATVNGITVGRGGGNVNLNTAIGYSALSSNTTGVVNVANGAYSMTSNTTGSENTAIGYVSLRFNTTGSVNTAIGRESLYANTTGNNNTALGRSSLSANTVGNNNTALGFSSGAAITTGNNNVILGSNNGSSIATSSNNIIISDGSGNIRQQIDSTGKLGIGMAPTIYALSVNGDINIPSGSNFKINGVNVGLGTVTGTGTTNTVPKFTASGAIGDSNIIDNGTTVTFSTDAVIQSITAGRGGGNEASNTAFGRSALLNNATGYANTAIGDNAMRYGTASANNVAIGSSALQNVTTGYANTVAGNLAMSSTTTGALNAAFGLQSMANNTTGNKNTSVGDQSLQMNVAKSESTAVGYYSMQYADSTTSAGLSYNTAVGAYSLQGSVTAADNTGTGNTSIGHSTLRANTTGTNNVAVGVNALTANVDGNFNVAVGDRSMAANTSGEQNVAIGIMTMFSNTTGNDNMAVGSYALQYNTTGIGNIGHGYESLASNTTGNYNIAIGTSSLGANTTGSYNIMLGTGGGGVSTGSYNVIIGAGLLSNGASSNNVIISDAQGNIKIQSDATGNTAIGTTPTANKLTVFNGTTTGHYTTSGWTHSSDARLKHDVIPLRNSLDKILQLSGVEYKFNNDPSDEKQIGFIAQQVEPVFPEVVRTDEKGFKSMIYSNLVAPIVEAIKSLKIMTDSNSREIASVKQENIQLKKENEKMKQRLDRIEKMLNSK